MKHSINKYNESMVKITTEFEYKGQTLKCNHISYNGVNGNFLKETEARIQKFVNSEEPLKVLDKLVLSDGTVLLSTGGILLNIHSNNDLVQKLLKNQ